MISNASAVAAERVANSITQAGVILTPINGTPLDVVTRTMQPIGELGENAIADAVMRSSSPLTRNFDAHSAEIGRVADMTAQQLLGNVRFVRSTINPLCREILTACNVAKANVEAESPLNINIINISPLPLFNSVRIEDMISRYNSIPLKRNALDNKLVAKLRDGATEVDLITAMKTTDASWNGEINKLITIIGLSDHTVNNLFLDNVPNYITGSRSVFEDPVALVNFILFTGILAGRLETFNSSDISMNDRAAMSSLVAYYGTALKRQIEVIRKMATRGSFLLPIDSDKDTVYVYERMYRAWVEKDGSSEALIAAVANGGSLQAIEFDLVNDPGKYVELFEVIRKRALGRTRQMSLSAYRNIVEHELLSYIKEDSEPTDRAAQVLNLQTFLSEYRLEATDDLTAYVKRATCEAIGKGTHAYFLQSEIDAYLADNDEATVQKASIHAVVKLMAKWAYVQMEVSRFDNRPTIAI